MESAAQEEEKKMMSGSPARAPPPPPEGGEAKSKRKMKTPSQLELLEKTYAGFGDISVGVDAGGAFGEVGAFGSAVADVVLPPEAQGQEGCARSRARAWAWAWAWAREEREEEEGCSGGGGGGGGGSGGGCEEMVVGESGNEPGSGSGSGSGPFEPRKAVARVAPAVARIVPEVPMVKRYYELPLPPPPPQTHHPLSESRAVASVERQLGGPIREDGPILGVEFDPLPPGAFGPPIGMTSQHPPIGRAYNSQFYERHDAKSIKTSSFLPAMEHGFLSSSSGGKRKASSGSAHMVHSPASSRALHEYQFLPEQPSVRSVSYERADPSHLYSPAIDASSGRPSSAPGYGFPGQVSGVSHLPQPGRQGQVFPSVSSEYDSVQHRNTYTTIGLDAQIGTHQLVGPDNRFISSERQVYHDEDGPRMEKKRKQSEEARIAKEVEAHEKRIRKELERQDILRRKREEQMRREMEKHDRERRKEEDRLLRERQREEERFQKEQKRELERREKFMQKETLRAEKLRQKEELRKEKEAARQKAANERATARRIAKESMELIEDERLELMELAASKKGLPSILSLDSETLQNLDSLRVGGAIVIVAFIPNFHVVWVRDGTDGSCRFLDFPRVWRFLITFADVLELWPFTLDEFVQALHDYDPRMLSEIHVALLRSIIKDIEDVARTPSIGLGANQNSSANPGGGHPQIVEGAYAWGFDICSWQRHLNSLTWPEILRQFALSAGYGPQLKKRNLERAYLRDDNEGHDGEDIVSTLRNGAAAENAAAVMQEKGFSNPRRSRHRLTPGTVKFAAFHVLSLEGSKGLTILEVADKIQKSGLRDLTTSKTPEASIAAALSRDTTLFERTAPSTYCVRAAFRKDPADAEVILSEAREKILVSENGFSDLEDGEKDTEYADDVERDDDSDSDVAEDREVDDMSLVPGSVKETFHGGSKTIETSSGNGRRETLHFGVGEIQQSDFSDSGKDVSSFVLQDCKEVNGSGASVDQAIDVARSYDEPINTEQDTEIDESNCGEPWVQGLTEGEYSDLSVEERLNALVALIGVAIEGNSIRVILEERLEAANTLKKQMWAEAQLDKRRLREDYVTKLQYSYMGAKAEPNLTSSAADGNQSPFGVENKIDASLEPTCKQEPIIDPQNGQSYLNNIPTERNLLGQDFSAGPDNCSQQHGYSAEKSRSQLKSYIGHKAEEMYVYRSLPLGQDRRRNRYWQFVASASTNDPGSGRIFVELQGGLWRLIDSAETFDKLLASLDTRGTRESQLHSMLQRIEICFKEAVRKNSDGTRIMDQSGDAVKIEDAENASSPDYPAGIENPIHAADDHDCDTLDRSSSFKIELGRTQTEKNSAFRRYQEFQKWMWRECFTQSELCAMKFGKKRCMEVLATCGDCYEPYLFEGSHCPICHRTFENFYSHSSFSEHVNQCGETQKADPEWNCNGSSSSLPLRIRMLKAQLSVVEVFIPPEALEPFWTEDYRKRWGMKLNASSSAEDILQYLTILEGAIRRDHLSSSFETTKELLGSSMPQRLSVDRYFPESVSVLSWVPHTTPAVSLRLMDLDASISYIMKPKTESIKEKEDNELTGLPSRFTDVKNTPDIGVAEALDQADYLQEDNWLDPVTVRSNSGRTRGSRGRGRGRTRGGRLQTGMRSESAKDGAGSSEKRGKRLGRRSQSRGRGRRRGTRSVRSRPKSIKNVVGKELHLGNFGMMPLITPKQNSIGGSQGNFGGMEWATDTRRMQVEADENSNSADTMESDENGQASGDDYDDGPSSGYPIFHDKSVDLMEESDDNVEEEEEEEEEGDDDNEMYEDGYEEGAVEAEEDCDMDVDGNLNGVDGFGYYGGEGIQDEDATSSGSSEYSD
ncbi:hypothetical protein Sjap_025797 [Stephania japonica]|uniref:Uncharacterized protein n=1 Tax=Stephania japonica TaxID=461633 RepID=A0AAP0E2F9_9MAGN